MFKDNLMLLRKRNGLSQEELAEKLDVSRQTLSKWETGESSPDILKCKLLADILGVSLDDLVSYDEEKDALPLPPKGKYAFGAVTLGEKGQIVIPAKARKIFGLNPGDRIFVLGDEEQGIALIAESSFIQLMHKLKAEN